MTRFEHTLNNPRAVLVVGLIAAVLNALLYFGIYLPKMKPLIGGVYAFGASLPEALSASLTNDIGKSDTETISHTETRFRPEAGGAPDNETSSHLEAISKFRSETSSGSLSEATIQPESNPPPSSPQASSQSSASPQASAPSQSSASPRSSVAPRSSVPPGSSASPLSSAPSQSSTAPPSSASPGSSASTPPGSSASTPPGSSASTPPLGQY
jgi:hypothetical protein